MGYEIRNDDSFSISENIWDSVYSQDRASGSNLQSI